jgi:hypothetical protein
VIFTNQFGSVRPCRTILRGIRAPLNFTVAVRWFKARSVGHRWFLRAGGFHHGPARPGFTHCTCAGHRGSSSPQLNQSGLVPRALSLQGRTWGCQILFASNALLDDPRLNQPHALEVVFHHTPRLHLGWADSTTRPVKGENAVRFSANAPWHSFLAPF